MENGVSWFANYGIYVISGLGLLLVVAIRIIGPEKFWTTLATFFKMKVISKGKVVRDYGDAEENKKYNKNIDEFIQKEYDASCGINNDIEEFTDMDTNVELEVIDGGQAEIAEFKNIVEYTEWIKKKFQEKTMCFAFDEETESFFDVAIAEGKDYNELRENFFENSLLDVGIEDLANICYDTMYVKLNRQMASLSEVENLVNHCALQDLTGSLQNVVVIYVLVCDYGTEVHLHRLLGKTNG